MGGSGPSCRLSVANRAAMACSSVILGAYQAGRNAGAPGSLPTDLSPLARCLRFGHGRPPCPARLGSARPKPPLRAMHGQQTGRISNVTAELRAINMRRSPPTISTGTYHPSRARCCDCSSVQAQAPAQILLDRVRSNASLSRPAAATDGFSASAPMLALPKPAVASPPLVLPSHASSQNKKIDRSLRGP